MPDWPVEAGQRRRDPLRQTRRPLRGHRPTHLDTPGTVTPSQTPWLNGGGSLEPEAQVGGVIVNVVAICVGDRHRDQSGRRSKLLEFGAGIPVQQPWTLHNGAFVVT